MVKKIVFFFLALQLVAIAGVVWVFANSSDDKLSWAHEAWLRMKADQRQLCFDVVREGYVHSRAPSIRMLSGTQEGDSVFVHYRITRPAGRFEERVHECSLVDGVVDIAKERRQLLKRDFSDITTHLK